ncbi:hypothetical protein H0H92_012934 [Tricholoma furcatifolium]|nr:hypothetical protein H0H92_012934 [Tricholoma furcatifolium]
MLKPSSHTVTFYDILGVRPSASEEEVRKAYRRKALETHPDKLDQTATEDDKQRAEEKFRDIREAFEVLGDAQRRKEYDAHLRSLRRSDHNASGYSEYLKNCLKDREQWARRRQEELSRSEQFKTQYPTKRQPSQPEELPAEVQQIVDAINESIDKIRPGWLERVRKTQEVSANKPLVFHQF